MAKLFSGSGKLSPTQAGPQDMHFFLILKQTETVRYRKSQGALTTCCTFSLNKVSFLVNMWLLGCAVVLCFMKSATVANTMDTCETETYEL